MAVHKINPIEDPPACERIYEALKEKYPGKIGWVRGSYNQSEIKYIIGQCDFFVGSRMHACIAAVSQCVPAVAIAYSDKFIGVMETSGAETSVADARKMDEAEILETVERAFEQRRRARKQLEQRMPQIKRRVLCLFDEIGGEWETLPSERSCEEIDLEAQQPHAKARSRKGSQRN